MKRFHINKHGVPAKCHAKRGNCPLGNNVSHFDTEEEAQVAANRMFESEHGILGELKNTGTGRSSFYLEDKTDSETNTVEVNKTKRGMIKHKGYEEIKLDSVMDGLSEIDTKSSREAIDNFNMYKDAGVPQQIFYNPDKNSLIVSRGSNPIRSNEFNQVERVLNKELETSDMNHVSLDRLYTQSGGNIWDNADDDVARPLYGSEDPAGFKIPHGYPYEQEDEYTEYSDKEKEVILKNHERELDPGAYARDDNRTKKGILRFNGYEQLNEDFVFDKLEERGTNVSRKALANLKQEIERGTPVQFYYNKKFNRYMISSDREEVNDYSKKQVELALKDEFETDNPEYVSIERLIGEQSSRRYWEGAKDDNEDPIYKSPLDRKKLSDIIMSGSGRFI